VEVSAQGLTAPSNSSAQANANAAAPAAAAAAAQPLSDAERQAQQDIAHERVDELDATHKRAYQLAERDALRAALATKRDLLAQVRASRANAQASERGQLDDEISRLQDNVTTADQKLQALDAERN
jgi:hypothetical protein